MSQPYPPNIPVDDEVEPRKIEPVEVEPGDPENEARELPCPAGDDD